MRWSDRLMVGRVQGTGRRKAEAGMLPRLKESGCVLFPKMDGEAWVYLVLMGLEKQKEKADEK